MKRQVLLILEKGSKEHIENVKESFRIAEESLNHEKQLFKNKIDELSYNLERLLIRINGEEQFAGKLFIRTAIMLSKAEVPEPSKEVPKLSDSFEEEH